MNLSTPPLTRSQVANGESAKKAEVITVKEVVAADTEADAEGEDEDEVTQEEDEEADAQDDDLDDDDEVDNFTTSEIVTVYVGPKRKRFFLHRELICERSPFMEKCLKKGHFDEGYKNELYLPEDDPKAFSIIVDWIYRSRIPQRTDPLFDVSDMSAAYCMADKFVMEELQNSIMDGIRASLSRKEGELCKTPHFSALALTHISGPPKSPLKRFLVEHMVHHMMKHPRWYHELKRNEPSRVDVEDLFKIPDLVFYIMKKIWQFQAEPWKDPATWDKCCYHVHATTVCQAKVPPAPAKPMLKHGVGMGPSAGLHGHNMRPGHGPWPGSALGGVWNPGVGW